MKKNYLFMALAAMVFTAAALTGCKKDPEPVKASSVAFKSTPSALTVGDEFTFEATVLPENAENKNVTWDSSDATVATVNAGVVKALAAGKSTITATAADGSGKKASFEVTVNEPEVASAVTIEGDGFDIDEQMTILASAQTTTPVKVDLASARGIDKLLVKIDTSNEAFGAALVDMGLGGEFDLANPGELETILSSPAVNLPNGTAVKGKTVLPFDISGFIPMIFAVAQGSDMTADFRLTVVDDKAVSETKTLQLNLMHDTQLPNAGFEDWHQGGFTGKAWCAYAKGAEAAKFWDNGNEGSSLMNINVTVPADDPRPGSTGTKSAKLASSPMIIVGMAAGNIYSGQFVETTSSGMTMGAKIDFGMPFTARPSALKFWYKAAPGEVDLVKNTDLGMAVGDTDKYRIYIALADSGFPHQVDTTKPETFVDYATHEGIIAYGELVSDETVEDWTEATIKLEYRPDSEDRKPTHIVVVASANMYGDYFTGSTTSVLCLDDMELVYE